MKKGILLTVFGALVTLIVYSYSTGAALNDGRDGTNAEGNQGGCGSCHSSATTDATKVELDSAGIAVTSYHGGASYTVKISASNGSTTTLAHFGFQLVVVKAAGAGTTSAVNIGTFGTLPTGVQNTTAANSGLAINIIEHSQPLSPASGTGGSGTTYVESIPWTAPIAGTGNVVIYGIINEVSSENPSKYMAATPVTITEASAAPVVASVGITQTAGTTTICQGSSVSFSATPTNGGAAPTYQWYSNGTAISGATASTFSSTTLAAGADAITCKMTSNLSGVTGSPATSAAVTVTVNTSVTASVSITSTTTSICTGQSVTFTATPTNGGASPTYQWYNGSTAISGATASAYSTTTLTGSPAITVKLTSDASCVSTPTVTSNAITVTVGNSIIPAVSITSSAGSNLCSGQSTTFTATATNGGTAPTYQWYKNGTAIGGATSSTYSASSFANNDAITCGIVSNSSCASPTTATSSAITISIVANGVPSLIIASSLGSTICTGQNVTFTATPTNGGSAPTYQWYNGSTAISGATSSIYSTNTITSGVTISCKMVSNSQCVSTTNATSNSLSISVSGAETPAVSIVSGSGNSICIGESVTFTATEVNGGASPTYQWYKGGTAISGATSSSYTSSTLVNGASITTVLTSSSACASPTTATSNAITISVNTGGTASVSVSSSAGTSICTTQSTTLSATPVNGGASPAYQWLLNGSNISGATSSTYNPSAIANGYAYTVQMVSSPSCVTQSTVVSIPLTFSVVAGGPALVTVASNVGLNICQGVGVTFNATATNGGSNPSYQWTKNGNNVGTSAPTYIDNSLANGDIINCSVSSSLSCASPATAVSNNLNMTVYTAPVAAITESNNVLTASQSSGYVWFLNNISVTNGNGQTLVARADGSYTVEVSDAHGCESVSAPFTVTTAGINDAATLAGVSVYPNPAENILFVDFKGITTDGKMIIRLFDMNGRILQETEATPVAGEKLSLDMSQVQDGIYLLQINQNDANAYRKIIVSR
jgi:hypothetical protein